ncbi:NADH-quinone oxidoreductase subunit NuoF [Beijerinckia sp. L45]|uniref:formate dehydrogenase beta subunit n=1 Tax=Beijerinckia sp. L45 TaxID=1641855 RepID=UPI00131CD996|nr:formate dehydrogenase beta subunit [Beijerinckia sp. L45]
MITIYVPCDAAAIACGANKVAAALLAKLVPDISIVRTGSRGLFWLEPMIEVATPEGRIAYGPVKPGDIDSLIAADFLNGGDHLLRLGKPEEIPYLARQTRLTFERCGVVDPLSITDYRAHGGYAGLEAAIAMEGEAITEMVKASGLRGRGGAGFPTGIKWNTVRLAQADQKYIVCNADEGDSGTFADRMVMEGDPFMLIEGMTIAGLAVGATKGYIYIRSEYPHAFKTMSRAIEIATREGALGPSVFGCGRAFTLEARLGAGAYICGEETSLLESLEGRRGVVRAKPPLPALEGLFGLPTAVNNVLSLATVPYVLAHGAQAYADYGMGRSRGTLCIQLGGNIKHGGLIEVAFGMTLREAIEDFGGGTASGRPIRAVQVGGPLGAYWPESLFDTPLDYEAFAAKAGLVGHGGIVVFDDTVDLAAQARFAFEFCAAESCGKCTPCRIGAVRGVETMDKIIAGTDVDKNMTLVSDLCQTMTDASLCAMGGLTPIPVVSAMTHFPGDFVPAPLRIAAE